MTELRIHTPSGEVSDHTPAFSPLTAQTWAAAWSAHSARVQMPAVTFRGAGFLCPVPATLLLLDLQGPRQ